MNKPLAQALQIVLLGVALLVTIALWARAAVMAESAEVTRGMGVAVCLAGAVGGVANNFRRV